MLKNLQERVEQTRATADKFSELIAAASERGDKETAESLEAFSFEARTRAAVYDVDDGVFQNGESALEFFTKTADALRRELITAGRATGLRFRLWDPMHKARVLRLREIAAGLAALLES